LALKASEEFSRPFASALCVIGYLLAFYFLSLVLKTIPVAVAYAIWAGMGIVLIALFGAVIYKEVPDLPAIIGMSCIILGVVIMNLFSKTTGH